MARKQTPERARAYSLKRRYGITLEQYQELLDKQDGKCAVCQRHESEFKIRLSVDHSHKTGEIRGLACMLCNKFMIGSHEDPDLLRRIADYISQGTGLFVPEDMVKPKRRRRRKKNG